MLYFMRTQLQDMPKAFTPFFWRPGFSYSRGDMRADAIAGVTIAVIQIPQAMALALVAGLPAVYGLFATIPGFIASVWGSSKQMQTGPVAIMSFLTLTALIPLAEPGTPPFIVLAALLALLTGLIQLGMGLFRLGFLVRLVPHSAIAGFASAAAAIIVISQIPTILGFSVKQHEFMILNIIEIVKNIDRLTFVTLIISFCSFALLFIFKKLPRAFPGTLVLLPIAMIAAYAFDLREFGIQFVDPISASLPTLSLEWIGGRAIPALLPQAALLAIVGFVESHAIARTTAAKTGQKLDTNQELVGQGLYNIGTGFFSGYPGSGSFTRTAVAAELRAKTAVTAIVASAVTVVALLFLSPLLSSLPLATLAAIVVMSSIQLIDIKTIRETYAMSNLDGIVAFMTFALALILKPDVALFIGIVLALVLFIHRTVWGARVAEMGIDMKWNVLRNCLDGPDSKIVPHTIVLRPGMSLYYANAEHLVEQMRAFANSYAESRGALRSLVIDCSGINFIDSTGIEVLAEFVRDMHARHVSVFALYMRGSVKARLQKISGFPEITILHNIAEMRSLCDPESTADIREKPETLHPHETNDARSFIH